MWDGLNVGHDTQGHCIRGGKWAPVGGGPPETAQSWGPEFGSVVTEINNINV